MKVGFKEYFVMINWKTREQLLCSWWENEPDCWGRKVYYIGVTNGLGGYRKMIEKGFIDRRFQREVDTFNKIRQYIFNRDKKKRFEDTHTRT